MSKLMLQDSTDTFTKDEEKYALIFGRIFFCGKEDNLDCPSIKLDHKNFAMAKHAIEAAEVKKLEISKTVFIAFVATALGTVSVMQNFKDGNSCFMFISLVLLLVLACWGIHFLTFESNNIKKGTVACMAWQARAEKLKNDERYVQSEDTK